MIAPTVALALACWLLGQLGFSAAATLAIALVAVVAFPQTFRPDHHRARRLKHGNAGNTAKGARAAPSASASNGAAPSVQSDRETLLFANVILRRLWNTADIEDILNIAIAIVESELTRRLPVNLIEISDISLGKFPPVLNSIDVLESPLQDPIEEGAAELENRLTFDVDVSLNPSLFLHGAVSPSASPRVVISVGVAGFTFRKVVLIENVTCRTHMRCSLLLSARFPYVSEVHLSFLSVPQVHFSVRPFESSVDVMSLPFASQITQDTTNYLLQSVLYPRFCTISLDSFGAYVGPSVAGVIVISFRGISTTASTDVSNTTPNVSLAGIFIQTSIAAIRPCFRTKTSSVGGQLVETHFIVVSREELDLKDRILVELRRWRENTKKSKRHRRRRRHDHSDSSSCNFNPFAALDSDGYITGDSEPHGEGDALGSAAPLLGHVLFNLQELRDKRDQLNDADVQLNPFEWAPVQPGETGLFLNVSASFLRPYNSPITNIADVVAKTLSKDAAPSTRDVGGTASTESFVSTTSHALLETDVPTLSHGPPDSGVLVFELEQGRDLTYSPRFASYTDPKELPRDFPSPYAHVYSNDKLVLVSPAKVTTPTPSWHSVARVFLGNVQSTIIRVVIKDRRPGTSLEHNPVLGVVLLRLGDIFPAADKLHESTWYPLSGGLGYGRLKITLRLVPLESVFTEIVQPPALRAGWDVGMLNLEDAQVLMADSIIAVTQDTLHSLHCLLDVYDLDEMNTFELHTTEVDRTSRALRFAHAAHHDEPKIVTRIYHRTQAYIKLTLRQRVMPVGLSTLRQETVGEAVLNLQEVDTDHPVVTRVQLRTPTGHAAGTMTIRYNFTSGKSWVEVPKTEGEEEELFLLNQLSNLVARDGHARTDSAYDSAQPSRRSSTAAGAAGGVALVDGAIIDLSGPDRGGPARPRRSTVKRKMEYLKDVVTNKWHKLTHGQSRLELQRMRTRQDAFLVASDVMRE